MSSVTTITLFCGYGEDEAVERLNEWIKDETHGMQGVPLEEVGARYPGTKGNVMGIWGGSYNYLRGEDSARRLPTPRSLNAGFSAQ